MIDFPAAIRRESDRLHEVVTDAGDLSRPVPSCPGWTLADLTWHIAGVQEFWAHIAGRLMSSPDDVTRADRPADAELVDHLRTQSADLVQAVISHEPDEVCWSWFDGGRTVGWVARRQAHEALIHRIDAELGAGAAVATVDPVLAADGIRELLTIFLDASDIPDWSRFTPDGRTCAIEVNDAGESWHLALGSFQGTSPSSGTEYDDPAVVIGEKPAGHPTARMTGRAADLDRWLWGRGDLTHVQVVGDNDAVSWIRAAAAAATQ